MKSKKLLLGSLSAMALVATPIAAVVSCDDGKKAEAATKASIVKATGDDFKITKDSKAYFVSKDDAAKAGSLVIGAETFTWDAALTDKTTKLKNDADKSDVTVTVAKATAGDFGLKLASGENKYFDAAGLKTELKDILKLGSNVTEKLGITLKFEDNKKLAADSLTELNTFLKSAALEAKDVVTDDAGNITLKLEAVSTTPVVDPAIAADQKAVKDAKAAFDALAITGAGAAGAAIGTANTTAGQVIANPTLVNLVSTLTGITLTAGNGTWAAPANGVTIKFKSVEAIASGATGNLVFELAKGAAKADVTIVITIA